MILGGELKAGQKVPSQREFSQTLKLSRASLREALLTLETLGLVRTEPGRGTFVCAKGAPAARNMPPWRYAQDYPAADVFQTRIFLERSIIGLSAAAMTDADIASLERATDNMKAHWTVGDRLSNVEADLEFHSVIVAACPNRMLVDLYLSARTLISETQMQPIPFTETERMRDSIGEHRRIIAALRARDAALAEREMANHILNTARCAGIDIKL